MEGYFIVFRSFPHPLHKSYLKLRHNTEKGNGNGNRDFGERGKCAWTNGDRAPWSIAYD